MQSKKRQLRFVRKLSLHLISNFLTCQRSLQKAFMPILFQLLFNFSPGKAGLRPVSTPVLDKSVLKNLARDPFNSTIRFRCFF